jgi:hypothetical protein
MDRRGRRLDLAVEALAPTIKQFRDEGIQNIRELAKRLNEAGIPAPGGGPFSYSAARRVLRRLDVQMVPVSGIAPFLKIGLGDIVIL